MKKLELKFGSIKEMLTKDQMKMINGGAYICDAIGTSYNISFGADNCCQAQAACDELAWSNSYSASFPNGCDCPCAMEC
jgi:hypothetical protein